MLHVNYQYGHLNILNEMKNMEQHISKTYIQDIEKRLNMDFMFIYCENFNCDLSKWNISNTNNYMFEGCDKFKYNIW